MVVRMPAMWCVEEETGSGWGMDLVVEPVGAGCSLGWKVRVGEDGE